MFTLRIHCWGGLGSQMYSLALAIDLLKRFPSRKICILFHTGGTTLRNMEMGDLPNNFAYKIINDFTKSNNRGIESLISNTYVKFMKNILMKLGFVSATNTTSEYKRLKPWVISIRGHYSHRLISYSTLEQVEKYLKLSNPDNAGKIQNKSVVALQYRLGDLTLKKKRSIVQVDKVHKVINELIKIDVFDSIDVFSDSSHKELNVFLNVVKPLNINYIESDPLNTVNLLRNYDIFIGTNSKISIWAIIFRLKDNSLSTNYCPANILPLLEYNLGSLDKAINLKTF